jgi:hypothetical protein
MTAYRVVVTQRMRKSNTDDRDWHDASFVEYHQSLRRAGFTVARFKDCEQDEDRILKSILVEVIRIIDTE